MSSLEASGGAGDSVNKLAAHQEHVMRLNTETLNESAQIKQRLDFGEPVARGGLSYTELRGLQIRTGACVREFCLYSYENDLGRLQVIPLLTNDEPSGGAWEVVNRSC